MQRYNIQVHPQLAQMSLGYVPLNWTKHAIERALIKGVPVKKFAIISAGTIVEVEAEGRQLLKVVARLRFDEGKDIILVLTPRVDNFNWTVVTTWLNMVGDDHNTLNLQRISA